MNYWATAEDAIFCEAHYVEDWEIARVVALSEPVRAFLAGEAKNGNKIKSINKLSAELSRPPSCGVLNLPEGMAFLCPIHHSGTRLFDGDEDGVLLCLSTTFRIYPTGYEAQPTDDAPYTSVRSAA